MCLHVVLPLREQTGKKYFDLVVCIDVKFSSIKPEGAPSIQPAADHHPVIAAAGLQKNCVVKLL